MTQWGEPPPSMLADFPSIVRVLIWCTAVYLVALTGLIISMVLQLPIGPHGDVFVIMVAVLVALCGAAALIAALAAFIASVVSLIRFEAFRTVRNIRAICLCGAATVITIPVYHLPLVGV